MRRKRFDLAVDLCTFSFFLTRVICRVPRRLKLQLPPLWWLRSYEKKAWARTHALYHYLNVVAPLGIEVSDPRPYFFITPEDEESARVFLREHGVMGEDTLVTMHPGGDGWYGKKRWPAEKFAALGDELVRRHGAKILLVGGKGERALAESIAQRMRRPCVNGAGNTTLKQTAALIQLSRLFIGNDSSPLHIATANNVPSVGIYGPSNLDNFRPLGGRHLAVQKKLSCTPCFHFIGSIPFWRRTYCRRCHSLEALEVSEVLAAAEELLELETCAQKSPFIRQASR